MASPLFETDENEVPFDDEDYEYADDDNDDEAAMKHLRGEMFNDDDDDDDDDDESGDGRQPVKNNNNRAEQNRSRASYNDEMNLIDYVIEEEKEIGGAKGEDSQSISRSTTYSRYARRTSTKPVWPLSRRIF